MKKFLQKIFINWIVKDLFNTVGKDDILRVEGNDIYYKKRKLGKSTVDKIKEDANSFEGSTIWRILKNELKYVHNLRMFEHGKTDEDLLAGKMGLYNLDIIEKKIAQIKNL